MTKDKDQCRREMVYERKKPSKPNNKTQPKSAAEEQSREAMAPIRKNLLVKGGSSHGTTPPSKDPRVGNKYMGASHRGTFRVEEVQHHESSSEDEEDQSSDDGDHQIVESSEGEQEQSGEKDHGLEKGRDESTDKEIEFGSEDGYDALGGDETDEEEHGERGEERGNDESGGKDAGGEEQGEMQEERGNEPKKLDRPNLLASRKSII